MLAQLPHLSHPLTPTRSVGTANLNCMHSVSVVFVQHCVQVGVIANGARFSLKLQSRYSFLGEMVATTCGHVRL